MLRRKQLENQSIAEGKAIIYEGEEANILSLEPVFIIKIKNKNHIVCGDRLRNEIGEYSA